MIYAMSCVVYYIIVWNCDAQANVTAYFIDYMSIHWLIKIFELALYVSNT